MWNSTASLLSSIPVLPLPTSLNQHFPIPAALPTEQTEQTFQENVTCTLGKSQVRLNYSGK